MRFVAKTMLYVPEELRQAVSRLARAKGVSEAELIRGALASYAAEEGSQRPSFPLLPSRRGPGTSDDAGRVDELLALPGFGEC